MATWTTLTYAALEVLSATKMNQNQANFTALIESAAGSPIPANGLNVIPGSAISGITVTQAYNANGIFIDQNGAGRAFYVDSESTTNNCIRADGKYPVSLVQDISSGFGLTVDRDIAEAGSNPLVQFTEDNTSGTQDVLKIQNDGTGNGLFIDNNNTGDAIEVDNASTGKILKLTTAISKPIRISPFDFNTEEFAYLNWIPGNPYLANSDGAFASHKYYAPLHLDHNQTIIELNMSFSREEGVMILKLYQGSKTGDSGSTSALITLTATSTGSNVTDSSGAVSHTIDLDNYCYFLELEIDNVNNTADQLFAGACIVEAVSSLPL